MDVSFFGRARIWVLAGWRNRAVSFKAVVYALVGVVNTANDYCVFLTAHAVLGLPLVAANTLSWMVAVSCSYMLNSTITFAAESGRKLRWLAYFSFVFQLRRIRHRRMVCQYCSAPGRRRGPALARVAGKAASRHGELHCELFNVTLCRVPPAPQSAGDHLIKSRRFPPSWFVEEKPACFVVRDHNGQQFAYVHFEEERG